MTRKIFGVACAAMIATGLFGLSARANTVYDLNYTSSTGTVTGFIETNTPPQPFGVLGTGTGTIVNWDITMTIGTAMAELAGPLQLVPNSTLNGLGTTTLAITASATALTADFGNTGTGGFVGIGSTAGTRLCFSNALTVGCAGPPLDISWEITPSGGTAVSTGIGRPAGDVIATAATTATPLPAALPLFATGIGGLGLFGWRRKRKAQALARANK
jgi:hypothetical protein